MSPLSIRTATAADHPVLERLWPLFRHDMSEFDQVLPGPDGAFRRERLEAALSGDPDWAAYLLWSGEHPAGLAFVRGLAGPARVLNSFFVVRGARRRGVGRHAARQVLARHPGCWEVAFQDTNPAAVRFWRRVATEATGRAGATWTEELRPVPGRPELPPDSWISFRVS